MDRLPEAVHFGSSDTDRLSHHSRIAIIGAGIGGLVLALELHRVGFASRVYESAPIVRPLGVGINLLPHSTRILYELGLGAELEAVAVATKESAFFNRFGQFIHSEPAGRAAGYEYPQFSIHRSDLHQVLMKAVTERLGPDAVVLDHRCESIEQRGDVVDIRFSHTGDSTSPSVVEADMVVACDGVHSKIRKQFYPDEGEPQYSGVMMWRGTTVAKPFLSGASMTRIGWLTSGKLVVYPIRDNVDGRGNQLINWVAELETPQRAQRDWTRTGALDDFLHAFEDWRFDWLDVPSMLRDSETILEYPMVDQDPLPQWTFGSVTLLGDAAHPMYPRGSNGAGQAILDGRSLAESLSKDPDPATALKRYEAKRLPETSAVVRANRTSAPDTIIQEVWKRTSDLPFESIDDVISADEIAAISRRYKDVAGYSLDALQPRQDDATP